jgi:hypothetical protein
MLLSGTLADLDLASIAAITSLGRASLRLELRESTGDLIGSLVLKAGRVVSATAGANHGRDALRVIMNSASDTRFQLAHEPLDFALASAVASVEELWRLAHGSAPNPGAAPGPGDVEPALAATQPLPMRRNPPTGTARRPAPPAPQRHATRPDAPHRSNAHASTHSGTHAGAHASTYRGPGSLHSNGTRVRRARAGTVRAPDRLPMMTGRLDEFDLLTLLQTVGVGRQLVEIEIRDRDEQLLGEIRVKSGQLLSAQAGEIEGVAAVSALLRNSESFAFAAFRIAAELNEIPALASVTEISVRFGVEADAEAARDTVVMEGSLSEFDLAAVLHTVGCTRQHCALQVHDGLTVTGTIVVKSGQVLAAQAGGLTGIPAVQQLINGHHDEQFRLIQLATPPPDDAPLGPIGQVLIHADAPGPIAGPQSAEPPEATALPIPSIEDGADTELSTGTPPTGAVVLEGKLAEFDVRTVLEVLASTRQHARLQVLGTGVPLGEIAIKAGRILSAQAGTLHGRAAVVFLVGASPQLRFRVLTMADGFEPREPLGAVHEVLAEAPALRAPGTSSRILRWAIPLSFALGGAIVFLVTRSSATAPSPAIAEAHVAMPAIEVQPAQGPAPAPTPSPATSPEPPAPAAPGAGAAASAEPTTLASAEPAAPVVSSATPPGAAPGAAPGTTSGAASATQSAASGDLATSSPLPAAIVNIKNAQAAFKQLGFDPGPVDNVYGKFTRTAILRFQRAQHLALTGVLDPQTWSVLVGQLMQQRAAR